MGYYIFVTACVIGWIMLVIVLVMKNGNNNSELSNTNKSEETEIPLEVIKNLRIYNAADDE